MTLNLTFAACVLLALLVCEYHLGNLKQKQSYTLICAELLVYSDRIVYRVSKSDLCV